DRLDRCVVVGERRHRALEAGLLLEPLEAHLPPVVLRVELGCDRTDADVTEVVELSVVIRVPALAETSPDRPHGSKSSHPGEEDDDDSSDRVHAGVRWHPARVQSTPEAARSSCRDNRPPEAALQGFARAMI